MDSFFLMAFWLFMVIFITAVIVFATLKRILRYAGVYIYFSVVKQNVFFIFYLANPTFFFSEFFTFLVWYNYKQYNQKKLFQDF